MINYITLDNRSKNSKCDLCSNDVPVKSQAIKVVALGYMNRESRVYFHLNCLSQYIEKIKNENNTGQAS